LKKQRRMVSAAIATAFAQETAKAAREQWRTVADQSRKTLPKLAKPTDDAKREVLSYMDFSRAHWLQIHSTNPLARLNAEIKRRTNVVGILPNDTAITRLVGAMLLEKNNELSLNRRHIQLEGLQSLSHGRPEAALALGRPSATPR
jgi:putative transposase